MFIHVHTGAASLRLLSFFLQTSEPVLQTAGEPGEQIFARKKRDGSQGEGLLRRHVLAVIVILHALPEWVSP